MSRNLLSIIVIVSIVVVNVNGRYVVKKNRIKILYPYGIMPEEHDAAVADFGIPLDGGAMVGSVMYSQKNSHACKPFDAFEKDEQPFGSNSTRPIILLVDRGNCFFTLKVYYGMQAGAAAVLVADDRYEPLKTLESPKEIFYEDRYIDKIKIPSALIDRAFGETLKAALQKGEEDVVLKLYWSDLMPN
ncbi:PA domain-containing protein [Heracleum sosnowskyi]|uniref:PA domain-containing protein n=1 Tax=Heracleum sosnowskyi TaxID=360622 RepID=A0AAD8HMG0_9APIA|nr:PA domain-containing protein [Heracleum sosnowskyi]